MQAVRDEILNIMHRNNIGEKRGTWMEDWHQKLHNNTTPDDVAICEAFIKFLESGGDNGAYWSVLSDAGGGIHPGFSAMWSGSLPGCRLRWHVVVLQTWHLYVTKGVFLPRHACWQVISLNYFWLGC